LGKWRNRFSANQSTAVCHLNPYFSNQTTKHLTMKKKLSISVVIFLCLAVLSCSSKKETAASIAQKWCELNAKEYKADGDAKEAAKTARKKFEDEMKGKYEKDEAFMKEIGKEVEKCEDASEGK
jgi:hypothetical protein